MDDERDSATFDLNFINNEVFFANTAYDYVIIEDLFAELCGRRCTGARPSDVIASTDRTGANRPAAWS
ncbi:hypothetical protein ACWEWI_32725 [Streptomyces sp. NPDC003753]|uniref:hypothetical protein n=1 Tax=unclassified Streptomyces TaxID=2593676 RepID=UPI001F3A7F31|nr:hypothetical protein [Streptomyces sp. Y2F8-2]